MAYNDIKFQIGMRSILEEDFDPSQLTHPDPKERLESLERLVLGLIDDLDRGKVPKKVLADRARKVIGA